MPDVFIIYAREDEAFAKKLYNDLREKGVTPWIDSEDLLGGSNWKHEISQAIRKSKYTLILLSVKSISKRGYVQKEVKEALATPDELPESEIFIIPTRIEECEPSHERLEDLNWVDLFPSYEKGLRKIIQTIRRNSEIGERIETTAQAREENKMIRRLAREDSRRDIGGLKVDRRALSNGAKEGSIPCSFVEPRAPPQRRGGEDKPRRPWGEG